MAQTRRFSTYSYRYNLYYVIGRIHDIDSCNSFVVYTLWEHPEALPMFYTVGPVIQKLIDGAGNEEDAMHL